MRLHVRRIFENICCVMLLLAVFINFIEIPLRVFFRYSFDLLFDFPVWITVWSLMLFMGFLLPDREHISIDFVRNRLKGIPRLILETLLAAITLLYGATITYGGILFVRTLKHHGTVYPRIISIPQWIVQLCVPLGMGIFTVFALIDLIRIFRKSKLEK